jgi:ABC-2 type transport system ATP-binding protein
VLQSTSLDSGIAVEDLLGLFGQLYPDPRPVAEALELVDLTGEARTKVGALSGGQRRRVDVAIGIIGRPGILFLDEPTTGLDPEARRQAWAGVANLTSTGTTVVLTTHYIEEADQLADRVIVIRAGRIIADTTPHELRLGGGLSTVRYPLPGALAAGLPDSLARHLDPGGHALLIRSADLAGILRELMTWAAPHGLDLAGLEVGPPSLEDAYLAVTGHPIGGVVS